MKLALICRPFVFHGGIETATAGLLGELVRSGYQIDLVTTADQPPVPGVTLRTVPVLAEPSLARLLSFAFGARHAVRRRQYDIVQSHERCLAQDIYRAGEGTHRGYLEAMGRSLARVNPYHSVIITLEKRIFQLRSSRRIVAISALGKTEIERLYGTAPAKVTLVYNGVDLTRFHPDNRKRFGAATRQALGLPGDAWVVLFVGSGFERKGLALLLEAMGRLADRNARLLVAGKGQTGEYRRAAERFGIADRVVWAGPRPDVERLYAAADAVALPARYEPFGNVHLEALASGVPVLSSPHAGGAELIRPGENGWVAAMLTAEAIAAGLDRLRDSGAGALSQAAREGAEPFTYGAQVDAMRRIYNGLTG